MTNPLRIPELCTHAEVEQCTAECEAMAKRFDEWIRNNINRRSNVRELTGHKVNPANDKLTVLVHDEPGQGGAHHEYSVEVPDGNGMSTNTQYPIRFQNGPIAEFGVNGLTHEALLAILIDRLQCFQAGQYSCRENAVALTNLEQAQMWLQKRTRDRMARNVEGTNAR